MPDFSGLLVKVRGDGTAFATAATTAFGAASVKVEPILRVPAQPAAMGIGASQAATWLSVTGGTTGTDHPWDAAHRLLSPGQPFAAAGVGNIEAIEPNLAQGWLDEAPEKDAALLDKNTFCAFDPQDESGHQATGPALAWNFGKSFSELSAARERVGNKLAAITIAHLDTGFDPNHITRPFNLAGRDLQRNFVDDGFPVDDASDHTPAGMEFARNRGHGTGTLSLLAGNKLDGSSPGWTGFTDFVGIAPTAKIIPVRIANWVVRFTTGTMVQGFDHAHATGAHVLSMSMGGVSSQALVDAVNVAYDAGLVMVTAAGNNYAWLPSPKSIVFPARLRRVLAACGVMADGRAYADLDIGTMQGNYGPAEKMDTALGAYTPNVPWAQIACGKVVDMNGRGTSAATPQIAAAAALWLAEHWDTVKHYSQPWMRVEAVRQALFRSALKSTGKMSAAETREKIGQGVLRAEAALAIKPPAEAELRKLPPAEPSWSWLNLIFGGGVSFAIEGGAISPQRQKMLALELTQMAQRVRKVDEAIDDPDRPPQEIPATARNRYLEAALDEGKPSQPLRVVLEAMLGRKATVGKAPPAKSAAPIVRRVRIPPTPKRRLRVYALDPSLGKKLDSIDVNETTLSVPWEEPLQPGPVGEYLEVVDVDPASDRVYGAVDLNDPILLAQDGWAPSEGNPQFHQQMVYAVAMTTIGHFEKAIGRKALWAPHDPSADNAPGAYQGPVEVPRLRIYPHALRTDNAYYSPDKKALLLGYFQSNAGEGETTPAGSMVFTCLSSDIVAHETTHALLDGMHRRFEEASNPDVPAFHEGFADIVALFQHFTIPELVRFEIASNRGNLMLDGLLGGLANEFGEASGRRGPLRNYAHADPKVLHYPDVADAHDRGSILVYAVYDAFRMIVDRRTKDLLRLATGGSGLLEPGAIHPDLVQRLTAETCKTADHVLRMCIRALDYCPTVDITFGDYLRAVITADLDAVKNDHLGYRIAFMEAFRKWNILPPDIRTVSEQTLAWNTPENSKPDWLKGLVNKAGDIRHKNHDETDEIVFGWNRTLSRSEIFQLNEDNRWRLWRRLKKAFDDDRNLYKEFGLIEGVPTFNRDGTIRKQRIAPDTTFEVHSVRLARRITPDGDSLINVIATITQRQAVPFDGTDVTKGFFWFRGGATLIIDPQENDEKICYSIIKNSGSQVRRDQQKQLITGTALGSLRALYFGGANGMAGAAAEPFAIMHADRGDSDNG